MAKRYQALTMVEDELEKSVFRDLERAQQYIRDNINNAVGVFNIEYLILYLVTNPGIGSQWILIVRLVKDEFQVEQFNDVRDLNCI